MADPKPRRPDWRGFAPRRSSTGGQTATNGVTAFRVAFLLMLCAGAAVGVFTWIGCATPSYLLSVPISEYASRSWPPNPFAEADADALIARFPPGRGEKAFESQQLQLLRRRLDGLASRADGPVVVHLTALAVARDGVVFLLPGDASPDYPDTALPLTEVLDALSRCPAREKLLLLDVAKPVAGLDTGVFADTVAEHVHAELQKRAGDLSFLVLTSCGPGELSLPMEEESVSAFAFYVSEGLSGWADGHLTTDARGDLRISARELARFVTHRVGRWAAVARGLRQSPTLYGPEELDFELARLDRLPSLSATDEEPPAAWKYPDWLRAAWDLRDRWTEDATLSAAPLGFRRTEEAALAAERRWEADGKSERAKAALEVDLAAVRTSVFRGTRRPAPVRTLAQTRVTVSMDVQNALRMLLVRRQAVPPLGPDALRAARDEFLTKFAGKSVEVAQAVFTEAIEDPQPGREKLLFLAELLEGLGNSAKFAETLLIVRFGRWKPKMKTWPAEAIHQALDAERAARQILLMNPAALPWVRAEMDAAATKRREALERLFASDAPSKAREAGEDLKAAARTFNAAIERAAAVREALTWRDRAFAELPGHAEGFAAVGTDRDVITWEAAVRAAINLAEPFDRPADSVASFSGDLNALTGAVRITLGHLRQLSDSATVAKLAGRTDDGTPVDYQLLRAALASPRPAAAARVTLWEAARTLGRRLHTTARALDRADDQALRPTQAPALPPLTDGGDPVARRARLARGLFQLAGFVGAEKLGTDPLRVRVAWVRELPSHVESRWQARKPEEADRLNRLRLPLEPGPAPRPGEIGLETTMVLVANARRAYGDWVADTLRADGKSSSDPLLAEFLIEAADDWVRSLN